MAHSFQQHSFLPYWVALKSALSLAGAMMTVLALSSSFLLESENGVASSAINGTYYFGVSVVGIFGGAVLHRFPLTSIGIFSPILSAIIVFFLSSFEHVPPKIGLPAIFCIFVLSGVVNPNNIRYYNAALGENSKMPFFSFSEGASAALNIVGPLIATYIIVSFGPRWCFVIDGFTYLLLVIPWYFVNKGLDSCEHSKITKPAHSKGWFEGFFLLWTNFNIRSIVINRMINNLAFVTFATALPMVIARISAGQIDVFAKEQGFANSLTSTGFIVASFFGIYLSKNPSIIVSMVFIGPFFAVLAYWLMIASLISPFLLFPAALLLGIGSYCYRISNMTLGQIYAPKDMLGPVIVAGDTIVRGWSFLVSILVVAIFKFVESENIPTVMFAVVTLAVPSLALLAPAFVLKLAKNYGDIKPATSK